MSLITDKAIKQKNVATAISGLDRNNKKAIKAFIVEAIDSDMPENLIYAVIHQMTVTELLENHEKVKNEGILSGFFGFSYISETVAFFMENQGDIIAWLHNRNNNVLGHESIVNIFKDNEHLEGVTIDQMNEALYAFNQNSEEHVAVANLLAWMVSTQLCCDLDQFMKENNYSTP